MKKACYETQVLAAIVVVRDYNPKDPVGTIWRLSGRGLGVQGFGVLGFRVWRAPGYDIT